jgi:hypothetical protein
MLTFFRYTGSFLGTFVTVKISFLASSSLSVPLHRKTSAPTQQIFMKFVFEHFFKICPENSTFIFNLKGMTGTFHEDQFLFLIIS